MSRLQFDTDGLPRVLVARAQGEVDMAVTAQLRAEMLAAVERHDACCLVVDLGAVEYIDSSGVELLFRVHGALAGERVELIVVAPPGSRAARLLRLVALGDVGEVRESLDEALQACSGG